MLGLDEIEGSKPVGSSPDPVSDDASDNLSPFAGFGDSSATFEGGESGSGVRVAMAGVSEQALLSALQPLQYEEMQLRELENLNANFDAAGEKFMGSAEIYARVSERTLSVLDDVKEELREIKRTVFGNDRYLDTRGI